MKGEKGNLGSKGPQVCNERQWLHLTLILAWMWMSLWLPLLRWSYLLPVNQQSGWGLTLELNAVAASCSGHCLAEWVSLCQTQRRKITAQPLLWCQEFLLYVNQVTWLTNPSPQGLTLVPRIQTTSVVLNEPHIRISWVNCRTLNHLEPTPDHLNPNSPQVVLTYAPSIGSDCPTPTLLQLQDTEQT